MKNLVEQSNLANVEKPTGLSETLKSSYNKTKNFLQENEWTKGWFGGEEDALTAPEKLKLLKEYRIKVINGKVSGKIPVDEYFALKMISVKGAGSDSAVLGRFKDPDDGLSYVDRAIEDGSMYFDLEYKWDMIQEKYGLSRQEMFELFNRPFLDDLVRQNKTIKFAHNPRLN